MRFISTVIILSILLAHHVKTQSNDDSTRIFVLDSLVVRGSNSSINFPTSIDYIDSSSLKYIINPLSIEDLLQTQSGIIVNNRYNQAQGDKIQIRGIGSRARFGVRGVKILLDGIPLTLPDGQSQLNNLNIQNLESIEIIKGPSSVLYGNSLGGAIILQSRIPRSKNMSLLSGFSAGSFGYRKYSLILSGHTLNNDFSINAYRAESEGFRDHSDSKFYGINLITKSNLSEKITLQFTANYYNASYLLNPSSLNKYDSENNPTTVRNLIIKIGSGKNLNQFHSGIRLQLKLDNNSKITSSFYGATRSLLNSIPGRIIELDRIFAGTRLEYENNFNLYDSDLIAIMGLNYEAQFDDRLEFINKGLPSNVNNNPSTIFDDIEYSEKLIDQDEDVKSFGLYAHLKYEPIKNINIITGVRFDNYNFSVKDDFNNSSSIISMNNISSTIGFRADLMKNINLFGNYSNGFQTPTTNEFSNNLLGEGGFNPNLKPEKINNYEIGARMWWSEINLLSSFSLYKMDITNMLIPYENESEETFYRNAGRANNNGVEVTLKFLPNNSFDVSGSYTFMNFVFDDYIVQTENDGQIVNTQLKDNYLPGIPKHMFSFMINYNFVENLEGNILFNWTDKYFTNDFNGDEISDNDDNYINDSYSKINLSLIYNSKFKSLNISLKLGIENLLNERYNDSIIPNAFGNNFFEPAASRSWYFSVSTKF